MATTSCEISCLNKLIPSIYFYEYTSAYSSFLTIPYQGMYHFVWLFRDLCGLKALSLKGGENNI
jgi:hypothetical protein